VGETAVPDERAVAAARARWRAAEDRLYPSVVSDPQGYQRGVVAVQAVVEELRRRAGDVADLVAAESAADEVVAAAGPQATGLPADLLVGVACGLLDREIAARQEGRRREQVVADARAAGRSWAVLEGPEPDALTDGRSVALHVASGAVVTASVDPWSERRPVFALEVVAADGTAAQSRTFTERADWLAEIEHTRRDIETSAR